MTVGELIRKLRKYPENTPAVVKGFDGYGFWDAGSVKTVPVVRVHDSRGMCDYDEPEGNQREELRVVFISPSD